tara:strand:+ start:132 stop:584 length:453 start_codon:yes stop_codon:yes gene_type:complete
MKKVKVIREKTGEEVMNERMDIIAQNGNDGLHYNEMTSNNNTPINYVEQHYPETSRAFQDLQFTQWELFCKKHKDYGHKNISVGTDLKTDEDIKLALSGLWFRMNDKMQRFQRAVIHDNDLENESLQDTFQDLANYAIIAQMVHEKIWGK